MTAEVGSADEQLQLHRLPSEIVIRIIQATDDWELATALLEHHGLQTPAPWAEQATPLDWAVLRGRSEDVQDALRDEEARRTGLSSWGTRVMVKFSYTHLLDIFWRQSPILLQGVAWRLLPTIASAWGRIDVLEWAIAHGFPLDGVTEEAMDDASRHGHVDVLEWWKTRSGRVCLYSDHALLSATLKGQIEVIKWWAASDLPLKLGKVLDYASMRPTPDMLEFWTRSGILDSANDSRPVTPPSVPRSRTSSMGSDTASEVEMFRQCSLSPATRFYTNAALTTISASPRARVMLDWWRSSGLPLKYNKAVLEQATRMGRIDALQWWWDSHLPIHYRWFDIDVCIEDAVEERRDAAARWWNCHGYDERGFSEWAKTRTLHST